MKTSVLTTILILIFGQQLLSQTLIGVYNTDFSELTIYLDGNNVTGTYKHENGRIEGVLNGQTITGNWYQSNGKGKFVFEFSADFSTFQGKWGYDNAVPSEVWNGNRIRGNFVHQPAKQNTSAGTVSGTYSTDFNEMRITQNGSTVTGSYQHQNGRIEGRLTGRTLTGMWYQDNGKGKFVFEFNADYSGFSGKWGYNDAEPSSSWNGKKL